MLYLLYLFIRKIELPHYYASLKLLYSLVDIFTQFNIYFTGGGPLTVNIADMPAYSGWDVVTGQIRI